MREAGVNTATVGVFSWSRLEPEEGRYDFGWLDGVLDRLHADGVRVILATPTASPPPWFTLAYPDAMPVTRDGTRLWTWWRLITTSRRPGRKGTWRSPLSLVRADAAVLMDFESQWALSAPVMPSDAVRHLDLVRGDHAALWRRV